ncbi:MAG: hypothetical protein ABSG59_18105 [Verrucomicrobiota bacterium]|jgi:hypothetical protein
MNPKRILLGSVIAATACAALAVVDFWPFPGWQTLESTSDVIVARCLQTPDPFHSKTNNFYIDPVMINSDMEIVSVLKGGTKPGPVLLASEYWPRQGEYYLIFAIYSDGSYTAVAPYRIVPLGAAFNTNVLKGKRLDENVRLLLRYRLDQLNEQLRKGQEEKKLLEEGLEKTNATLPAKK